MSDTFNKYVHPITCKENYTQVKISYNAGYNGAVRASNEPVNFYLCTP